MSNENTLQHLASMLEAYAIPEFSLPAHAVERIKQIHNTFFATQYDVSFLAESTNLEQLLENYALMEQGTSEQKNGQDKDTVLFFGCGITGYGVQNWHFYYILLTPKLRIMLRLPYGNAYGNADVEKECLEYGIKFIQICQQNLLQAPNQSLSIFFSEEAFSYCVTNEAQEKIHEGSEIAKLLDLLMTQDTVKIPQSAWLQV